MQMQMHNLESDYDDIIHSYGYLGDMLPSKYLSSRYTSLGGEKREVNPEGCLYEWSEYMLKQKMFSTEQLYLIESNNQWHLIKMSCFVTLLKDDNIVSLIIYDSDSKQSFLLTDSVKIHRCIGYDGYIRAANLIKYHWNKYKVVQFKKRVAIIKLQRAVKTYIYRPNSHLVKQLSLRFCGCV